MSINSKDAVYKLYSHCSHTFGGKPRFVNKHPENSVRILFLKAIFPDALFIHLVRDGRAVVRSSLAMRENESYRQSYPLGFFPKPKGWRQWSKLPIELQFAHQWHTIVTSVRQHAGEHLNQKNYFELPYDHFCHDVHASFIAVDQFCKLDPNRRLFKHIPRVIKNQDYKWKEDLDLNQLKAIEAIVSQIRI